MSRSDSLNLKVNNKNLKIKKTVFHATAEPTVNIVALVDQSTGVFMYFKVHMLSIIF